MVIVVATLMAGVLVTAPATALTPAGHVDLSFGSCGVSTILPRDSSAAEGQERRGADAVAVQPDGRIVLAGSPGVTPRVAVTRLLADGSLDYSFGYNGTVLTFTPREEVTIGGIGIQSDGRIVVGGTVTTYEIGAPSSLWFTRYLPSGAVDTTFGSNGVASGMTNGDRFRMVLQPDGKILAGGSGGGLVRLLPSGALDSTFGSGGVAEVPPSLVTALTVQPDGKIVAGMRVEGLMGGDFGIFRLHPNGSPDETFGSAGLVTVNRQGHDQIVGVAIDGSGRVVSAGTVWLDGRFGLGVTRHLPNGEIDLGFGEGGLAGPHLSETNRDTAVGLVLEPDGKAVVSGNIRTESPTSAIGVVRFTVDGELDPTFGEGGKSVTGRYLDARAVARAPDGGVIVAGESGEFRRFFAARFLGTGPVAAIPVTAATCNKEASLSPQTVTDFGSWAVGTRSTPRAFTFNSTGTAPVRVDKVEFSKDGRGQYLLASDGCSGRTIAPGSSCRILVSYAPTFADYSTPKLLVWSNASDGAHSTLHVGTGRPLVTPAGSGWNGFGAVGAGPAEGSALPVPVNLSGAASVTAGYYHSLGVKVDGTVWAWGWNGFGQLGDGTVVNRSAPVRVPGLSNMPWSWPARTRASPWRGMERCGRGASTTWANWAMAPSSNAGHRRGSAGYRPS